MIGIDITKALQILTEGDVIAYPTETVYGLGADATNEAAIKKVFSIKGRNFDSPISVIIPSRKHLQNLVSAIPEYANTLMDSFWPGALTIIFPALPHLSPLLTAASGKIGVRISPHPVAHSLAIALDKPITATSANISGRKECRSAAEVYQQLAKRVDWIIEDRELPLGIVSTIVDVSGKTPIIIREGAIASTEIFGVQDKHVLRALPNTTSSPMRHSRSQGNDGKGQR